MATKRKTYFVYEVKRDKNNPGNYMIAKVRIGQNGKMSEKPVEGQIPDIETAYVKAAEYRKNS